MGCKGCGGKSISPPRKVVVADNLILMEYIGDRKRDFVVVGGVTRTRYTVTNRMVGIAKVGQGVKPPDVGWFLSVDYGKAYRLYEEPEPEPEVEE